MVLAPKAVTGVGPFTTSILWPIRYQMTVIGSIRLGQALDHVWFPSVIVDIHLLIVLNEREGRLHGTGTSFLDTESGYILKWNQLTLRGWLPFFTSSITTMEWVISFKWIGFDHYFVWMKCWCGIKAIFMTFWAGTSTDL